MNNSVNKIYNKVAYSSFTSRRARISNVPVVLSTGKVICTALCLHIKYGIQYGYSRKRWFKKENNIWTQCGAPT